MIDVIIDDFEGNSKRKSLSYSLCKHCLEMRVCVDDVCPSCMERELGIKCVETDPGVFEVVDA